MVVVALTIHHQAVQVMVFQVQHVQMEAQQCGLVQPMGL